MYRLNQQLTVKYENGKVYVLDNGIWKEFNPMSKVVFSARKTYVDSTHKGVVIDLSEFDDNDVYMFTYDGNGVGLSHTIAEWKTINTSIGTGNQTVNFVGSNNKLTITPTYGDAANWHTFYKYN